MKCLVEISRPAEREFRNLPAKIQAQIRPRLLALENAAFPGSSKRLRGSDTYRLRSGDYRVVYRVDARRSVITILAIGHRREVYRALDR